MSAPQPIASGDIATRPLEHLLFYVQQNQLSGTLVVWPADQTEPGQDRLLFQQGRLRKAQLRTKVAAVNGVIQLFERSRGVFAFYAEDVTTQDAQRVSFDILALVTAGLRQYASRGVMPLLRRFGGKHLRLRTNLPLPRFNFNPEELAVVQLLRAAPATVSRLCELSGDPKTAERVIYVLALSKFLQPYDAEAAKEQEPGTVRHRILSPEEAEVRHALESLRARSRADQETEESDSLDPPRSPSIPPPTEQLSPELRETWNELISRHDRSKDQNHFEVLGLSENATTDEVKAAFLPLIKRWHPDRLPAELTDLRPWADRYFHRINQAHDTLSNPKKRAEYIASQGEDVDEEQEQVDRALRAAMEYRKVEVLIKRKLWSQAQEMLDQVLELDDSDADYHVAKATIMFRQLGGKNIKSELQRIKHVLDKALEMHDEHAEAWYLRGELYEREGDERQAFKAFKRVLSIKPNHLQASRKVRLANMRKSGDSTQSDLLGRFFGKKK